MPILVGFPLLLAPLTAPLVGGRQRPVVHSTGVVEGSGGEITVSYRFAPEAPYDPADLRVDVPPPPGVDERQPPQFSVDAGVLRLDLTWSVPEPTVARAEVLDVRWEDPLGLVERPTDFDDPVLLIERYPPELQRAGVIRLEHTVARPGETRSRAIGRSGEFFGIRVAVPLDPPRAINWLASARAGRRLANEFALERTGDVLLLIDARPTSLGPTLDARLLGLSRAAAYGLAEAFLREKSRVGLAVFGEFVETVPLSSGRAHRLRLHEALFSAGLAATAAPAERCAVTLRRFYPRGVTTVLLSPLADDESLLLVPHLTRRGYRPVVLSPSYLPLAAATSELDPADEAIVARVGELLRREQIARAWRDAPAIDWVDFWSLAGFVDFLKRPTLRERGA